MKDPAGNENVVIYIYIYCIYIYIYIYIRGWTTSYFLKSTFMWWKLSRSRLVADDVINAQISLELRQTPCAQLWHMTQHCPHGYCSYNSLFLSVLSSLGHYISHRFLLVLNQIQISSTVKITFIWMHKWESDCVWINSTWQRLSLLVGEAVGRAGFTHRHSRHVPMLARPGGPKHNEEIYNIFCYGYLQQ